MKFQNLISDYEEMGLEFTIGSKYLAKFSFC